MEWGWNPRLHSAAVDCTIFGIGPPGLLVKIIIRIKKACQPKSMQKKYKVDIQAQKKKKELTAIKEIVSGKNVSSDNGMKRKSEDT